MTRTINKKDKVTTTDLTDTGHRLRKIEYIDDLVAALRSNRAPRGRAAERNELMTQARALKADMDHMLILNMNNSTSTYDGLYPQTIGVAVDEKRREIFQLGQKCVDLLPGYIWRLENPPAAVEPQSQRLRPLDVDAPVLEITDRLARMFTAYIRGNQSVTDLVYSLKAQGITVRSIGPAHRGSHRLNQRGTMSFVIVHDRTGHYNSVIV